MSDYADYACDLKAVLAILRLCGIETDAGEFIRSDVVSGSLYRDPREGLWMIREVGLPYKGDKYWMIPEYYAAFVTKRPIERLGHGERITWQIRALLDARVAHRPGWPYARFKKLPKRRTKSLEKLYEGILDLWMIRHMHEPGQAEHMFGQEFMTGWCDIGSKDTVAKGLKWLEKNSYIREVRREPNDWGREDVYYDLAPPEHSHAGRQQRCRRTHQRPVRH